MQKNSEAYNDNAWKHIAENRIEHFKDHLTVQDLALKNRCLELRKPAIAQVQRCRHARQQHRWRQTAQVLVIVKD